MTGCNPSIMLEERDLGANVIIAGAIGKSRIVDRVVHDGKLEAKEIAGKWESFLVQVIPAPLPGVRSALIVTGSNRLRDLLPVQADRSLPLALVGRRSGHIKTRFS